METIWIEGKKLSKALQRNEAFWSGELEGHPLLWIMAPGARPGRMLPAPAHEEEMWTDPDYVFEAAEIELAATYFAGDALPFYQPWLGPDQVAAFLGAKLALRPKMFTSWVTPFVDDWAEHPQLKIDPDNPWWKLYLELYRRSVEAGRGKWVTCYPDLHTGIDALSAIRGPEALSMDLLMNPEPIHHAMDQMTKLFRQIVDTMSSIILPAGQGTSNWSLGWSAKRYLCIGQNDFTCMISPQMFDTFCLRDTNETAEHVDVSLYHLDGPGALPHLPRLLEIGRLTAIQWIPGDGNPPPTKWLDLLRRIQAAGKPVQVLYNQHTTRHVVNILDEVDVLCRELNPARLFIAAYVDGAAQADAVVERVHQVCRERRGAQILTCG